MNRYLCIIISLWALVMSAPMADASTGSMDELRRQICDIVNDVDGVMGVAVVSDADTLLFNNGVRFPMMSVFKLHQAVATAETLRRRGSSLDTLISVGASELDPATWSPCLKEYIGKPFRISAAQLVRYALEASDNNASNLLFDHLASPAAVDSLIRQLAPDPALQILWSEAQMKRDHDLAYDNFTSPLSAALLLRWLFDSDFMPTADGDSIRKALAVVTTGRDRLAAAIEGTDSVFFAHKTGSGYRNSRGELAAHNDVGYFRLPDGRDYAVAVFVRDFRGTESQASALIARISAAVLSHFKDAQ